MSATTTEMWDEIGRLRARVRTLELHFHLNSSVDVRRVVADEIVEALAAAGYEITPRQPIPPCSEASDVVNTEAL